MNALPDIAPVILAGGQGRRLWPLTGPSRPKPFLRIFSGLSLLQQTVRRVSSFSAPLIVCHHSFARRALDELLDLDTAPSMIICEPAGRGTAMAVALAALTLEHSGRVMLVTPSDHHVENESAFRACAAQAAQHVTEDAPVLLGVRPLNADPRYGYIRTGLVRDGVYAVGKFTEKPPAPVAQALYNDPAVFWNTGVFLATPACFLNLLGRFAPVVYEAARRAFEGRSEDDPFLFPGFDAWANAPALSVDHAVLERCPYARLVPLETPWYDIGCWRTLLGVKLKTSFQGR